MRCSFLSFSDVRRFWGQKNYDRLLAIKKQIDPTNILSASAVARVRSDARSFLAIGRLQPVGRSLLRLPAEGLSAHYPCEQVKRGGADLVSICRNVHVLPCIFEFRTRVAAYCTAQFRMYSPIRPWRPR